MPWVLTLNAWWTRPMLDGNSGTSLHRSTRDNSTSTTLAERFSLAILETRRCTSTNFSPRHEVVHGHPRDPHSAIITTYRHADDKWVYLGSSLQPPSGTFEVHYSRNQQREDDNSFRHWSIPGPPKVQESFCDYQDRAYWNDSCQYLE